MVAGRKAAAAVAVQVDLWAPGALEVPVLPEITSARAAAATAEDLPAGPHLVLLQARVEITTRAAAVALLLPTVTA